MIKIESVHGAVFHVPLRSIVSVWECFDERAILLCNGMEIPVLESMARKVIDALNYEINGPSIPL